MSAIAAVLTAQCATPAGNANLTLTLAYNTHDPYALTFVFTNHTTHQPVSAPWFIGRGLFTTAFIYGYAGEGDVHLHKLATFLLLNLSSPDGVLDCWLPFEETRAFVALTTDLVPLGAESHHLDINALIGRLLGEVPS